jgi:hypothetical protein
MTQFRSALSTETGEQIIRETLGKYQRITFVGPETDKGQHVFANGSFVDTDSMTIGWQGERADWMNQDAVESLIAKGEVTIASSYNRANGGKDHELVLA